MTQDPANSPQLRMIQLLTGAWVAQAVGAFAELNIADHLADGVRSTPDLAARTRTDAAMLTRLLRAIESVGIVERVETGGWVLTPMGTLLRSDVPHSLRAGAVFLSTRFVRDAWSGLTDAVRSGRPAFEAVHGKDLFTFVREHEDGARFQDWMTQQTLLQLPPILAAYDLSGARTLVDVGGGHGTLLAGVLSKYSELRGILFDLAEVVASAPAIERCEKVAGDFFASVPEAADVYLMKQVLHDWSDEDSIRILTACARAMKPTARLLVIELVIPDHPGPDRAKWMDINMLVMTPGGRERTEVEWRNLCAPAGLRLARVVPTAAGPSVLELVRA